MAMHPGSVRVGLCLQPEKPRLGDVKYRSSFRNLPELPLCVMLQGLGLCLRYFIPSQ